MLADKAASAAGSEPCAWRACSAAGTSRCSRCRTVFYCSAKCQKRGHAAHKSVCQAIADNKLPAGPAPAVLAHLTADHFGGKETLLAAWDLAKKADAGDKIAESKLKKIAEEGHKTKDPQTAHHQWLFARLMTDKAAQSPLETAANNGHAGAMAMLGFLELEERGKLRQLQRALWFAALPDACETLANECLGQGFLGTDYVETLRYVHIASEASGISLKAPPTKDPLDEVINVANNLANKLPFVTKRLSQRDYIKQTLDIAPDVETQGPRIVEFAKLRRQGEAEVGRHVIRSLPPLFPYYIPFKEMIKSPHLSQMIRGTGTPEFMLRDKQDDIDSRWWHFRQLCNQRTGGSDNQLFTVQEWKALYRESGHIVPPKLAAMPEGPNLLDFADMGGPTYRPGLDPDYVPPANPPTRTCGNCKNPAEPRCACGETYCSYKCLAEDWKHHKMACWMIKGETEHIWGFKRYFWTGIFSRA